MLVIVSDGFTPPVVGKTEPSQTHRLGMSQLRQSELTTLVAVVAHARRAGEMVGIVLLPKDIARADSFQADLHLAQGVLDQALSLSPQL